MYTFIYITFIIRNLQHAIFFKISGLTLPLINAASTVCTISSWQRRQRAFYALPKLVRKPNFAGHRKKVPTRTFNDYIDVTAIWSRIDCRLSQVRYVLCMGMWRVCLGIKAGGGGEGVFASMCCVDSCRFMDVFPISWWLNDELDGPSLWYKNV